MSKLNMRSAFALLASLVLASAIPTAVDHHEDNWEELKSLPTVDTSHDDIYYSGDKTCSTANKEKITAAMNAVKQYINTAATKDDPALFNKYFGTVDASTNWGSQHQRSDAEVKLILSTVAANYDKMSSSYEVKCCNGHCKCGATTLAFVFNGNVHQALSGDKYAGQTNVRGNEVHFCDRALTSLPQVSLGFTLFHELVHMYGGPGDGLKDYSNTGVWKLGRDQPTIARNQAQSYTFYAMEVALSSSQFEAATTAWDVCRYPSNSKYDAQLCEQHHSSLLQLLHERSRSGQQHASPLGETLVAKGGGCSKSLKLTKPKYQGWGQPQCDNGWTRAYKFNGKWYAGGISDSSVDATATAADQSKLNGNTIDANRATWTCYSMRC